jgi:hypothetical protein
MRPLGHYLDSAPIQRVLLPLDSCQAPGSNLVRTLNGGDKIRWDEPFIERMRNTLPDDFLVALWTKMFGLARDESV